GSSKAHTASSVETCSAEVQKGNAPEERKLQRMFRKASVCRMIKRCNDFGAGGVSVAIGELADGLRISLDAVPKKYDGLDGTELAISESQERMAVVIAPEDLQAFLKEADAENLEATVTAVVTEEPRLVMSWNGKDIVNVSREFLNSNGAEKHMTVCPAPAVVTPKTVTGTFRENLEKTVSDLNVCSKRGLSERFDATIGAGSVFMPFGGKDQLTPIQAMAQKISMEEKHTDDCSVMAWGYDPELSSESPYHGAYSAVVESVSKLVASGASFEDVYLTFQEYFEKPGHDGKRWGKPLSALLGAMEAQMALGIGAVGGKDSMSGSFENLDVPPTLISFAVTTDKAYHMVSPELKEAGHRLVLLSPEKDRDGLPVTESLLGNFRLLTKLFREGNAFAAYTLQKGGIAEAAVKMAMGNGLGVKFEDSLAVQDLFEKDCGAFLVECAPGTEAGTPVGTVLEVPVFILRDEAVPADELYPLYEGKLEPVYPVHADAEAVMPVEDLSVKAEAYPAPAVKCVKPRVLIPAFPGTNCEYDSARAFRDAGAEPEIVVIRNRTEEDIRWSVEQVAGKIRESQIVFLPGGFSGGDEPDGSGKFITSFFRNPGITDAVRELLDEREGLMAGICNGFQALVKLGLVPYGKIVDASPDAPTLTFNTIGRHQSKIVTTRIASNRSPWLALTEPGMSFKVPISHGEGRFYASPEVIRTLIENGQVATQYADPEGHATMEIQYNPNGSVMAVEGITSPDGRVFGKMGHSERIGKDLYRNVPGNYDIRMFEAAVRYYRLEL
ncbi:MAG: phosphoribosylformylglycinamidine synthase subunit PurQ, partial [Lachnospiraceae bacterium]|nr:phosphoribosylformylglycinamidine synthase subunit PurQ [Lachnospiraceae bacterium]